MKHSKIIGIGFNKTGTSSLGTFLQQLDLGPVCNPISTRVFFETKYNSIPAKDKKDYLNSSKMIIIFHIEICLMMPSKVII